ncbi:MAG: T9SS type A sorting domain-containing protein [Bacteroidetes bacterium]|nr:T9SS type A sorting domain-containing protein [Bacteroidota bacterium]
MKKTFTLFLLLLSTAAIAQITNGNFENWTTVGSYETPDNWDNLNATTNLASVYTCEKGGTASPYYLKLTSKVVTGLGTIPGVAVYGKIDVTAFKAKSGYPFTGRPKNLIGKWQYMASGADQGVIGVYLTAWNLTTGKRDTVASNAYLLPGMVMSWTSFSIPINYYKNVNPDTLIIGASSSGLAPVAGSYLYLDSLDFSGTVPVSVEPMVIHKYTMQASPNPATTRLMVDFGQPVNEPLRIQMTDVLGRVIKDIQSIQGVQVHYVDVANLPKGIYYLKAKTENDILTQKIEVQ